MRAGDANRRVRVSSIFHSKRLNNDGPPSASSRLVSAATRHSAEAHKTRSNSLQRLAMRILFATRDLSLGKHCGVLSSSVEAKLKRFSRSNPRCRGRSRRSRCEKCIWRAILRNINLARSAVSGIPSYRRSTRSFACGHRVRRCRNRCRACRRTGSRRICLGVFRWPACSEEEQRQ